MTRSIGTSTLSDVRAVRPPPVSSVFFGQPNVYVILFHSMVIIHPGYVQKKRSKMAKEADEQPERRATFAIRLRRKVVAELSVAPESPHSSEPPDSPKQVKQETPDRETAPATHSSPHSRSSPLPKTPSPPPRSPERLVPEVDLVMEDYYHRSRRRGTRELSPFTLEAASSWTWRQVKEPVWVLRSYSSSESHDSGTSSNERNEEGEDIMLETCVDNAWRKDVKIVAFDEHDTGSPPVESPI